MSGTFCPECDEQYWIRWREGVLKRGGIPMKSHEQIDKLVHEKVMGKPIICKSQVTIRWEPSIPHDNLQSADPVEWKCMNCDTTGGCRYDSIPTEHTARIQAYSTDMNAAMLIFKHFAALPDEPFELRWTKQLFWSALGMTDCGDPAYLDVDLQLIASWTAEKVSLAGLTAYNVEVEP